MLLEEGIVTVTDASDTSGATGREARQTPGTRCVADFFFVD
jgi:hypothetical protein